MNALNGFLNGFFDLALWPLERIGFAASLIVVSGIFGVLALMLFKRISWQAGIKATKDRIKGHLIEIRIYQDDLWGVVKSIGKILARNFQYLFLNFWPILPLIPFFLILAAQFVTRYAYDPVAVQDPQQWMSGRGVTLQVELAKGHESRIDELEITIPEGLVAMTPLVSVAAEGRAFQEIVAVEPGEYELELRLGGDPGELKRLVAGEEGSRAMQPRRVNVAGWYNLLDPDHCALLWPAERSFATDSPYYSVAFTYPNREQPYLMDGELGILVSIFIFSILFGIVAIKPLGVQI